MVHKESSALDGVYVDRSIEYEPPIAGDDPVNTRVDKLDCLCLIDILNEQLSEFAHTVGSERANSVEIVGVVVIGSYITEDFDAGQSDLDLILVFDEPYADFEGFARSIRQETGWMRNSVFHRFDTPPVTKIDPTEQTTIENIESTVREPYVSVLNCEIEAPNNSNKTMGVEQ